MGGHSPEADDQLYGDLAIGASKLVCPTTMNWSAATSWNRSYKHLTTYPGVGLSGRKWIFREREIRESVAAPVMFSNSIFHRIN